MTTVDFNLRALKRNQILFETNSVHCISFGFKIFIL